MKRKSARWLRPSRCPITLACAPTKQASICSWKSASLNMPDAQTNQDPSFTQAFVANEREQRIYTGKVACLLVVFLMPAGLCLDLFVYPGKVDLFLSLP